MISTIALSSSGQENSLPPVLDGVRTDLTAIQLRLDGARAASKHLVPEAAPEWFVHAAALKAQVNRDLALTYHRDLPLEMRETGAVRGEGFTVRNISFQTQRGIWAPANLYVPDGGGPFPAVVVTHGHWPDGRRHPLFQAVAQTLVRSGYVCLALDAWGAGERGTIAGQQEYHGANLGASLMATGHTLMGLQLADNMRGIDLLSSLPFVDSTRIGATGASGGGNQSMWLAALDERVKAVMPVVSVGTFCSYIMNSNCVCELLPNGLTYTEEGGILALVAPRALKIVNAVEEKNPSFMPQQMLVSFRQAQTVYRTLGAADRIAYHIAAGGHDYSAEMREHLLGWFNHHLKGEGTGIPQETPPVQLFDPLLLATYPDGNRDEAVWSTERFCQEEGQRLRALQAKNTRRRLSGLQDTIRQLLNAQPLAARQITVGTADSGWQRLVVETDAGNIIPVLFTKPKQGGSYILLLHGAGKTKLPQQRIQQLRSQGYGVMVADLWGTGEQASDEAQRIDGGLPPFHTLARSSLWLGKPVMGIWAAEIQLLLQLCTERLGNTSVCIEAYREAGVATAYALALSAKHPDRLRLIDVPCTYLFDSREGIDAYSMAIHVPRILQWGDIPLLLAMAGTPTTIYRARTLSGRLLGDQERQDYIKQIETLVRQLDCPPFVTEIKTNETEGLANEQ